MFTVLDRIDELKKVSMFIISVMERLNVESYSIYCDSCYLNPRYVYRETFSVNVFVPNMDDRLEELLTMKFIEYEDETCFIYPIKDLRNFKSFSILYLGGKINDCVWYNKWV